MVVITIAVMLTGEIVTVSDIVYYFQAKLEPTRVEPFRYSTLRVDLHNIPLL
jgi:hypothetical protein